MLGSHHLLHGWGVDDQATVFITNQGDFYTWPIPIPSYGCRDISVPVVAGAYHNIVSPVCSCRKPHENIVVMVCDVHSGNTSEIKDLAICHPGNEQGD